MDRIRKLIGGENSQPEFNSAYIKNILLNGFQTSPHNEEFITLKTWLEDENKRPDGLFLLRLMIPECSDGDFDRNALNWIQICCQTINGLFSVTTKQLACSIVILITLRLNSFMEVKKDTIDKFLPVLVTAVVNLSFKETWLNAGLDLLSVLMEVFQHHCFKLKCHIEDFLMGILKGLKFDNIEALSACISKLPMINHPSPSLAQYKNSWREVVEHLTSFLQETWDKLYLWFNTETNDAISMAANSNDVDMMAIVNDSLVYKAVVICLTKILEFSKAPVEIPVNSFLKFVQIPVNYRPFNTNNEELKFFEYNVLPNIQIASLLLLESLIAKFHRYLIRDAAQIAVMLENLLSFASFGTANTKHYTEKTSRTLRCHTYKVLLVMIQKMQPILSRDWLLSIFESMRKDIDLNSTSSSCESSQRVRNSVQEQQLDKALTNKTEVCVAALKVLSSIFSTCSFLESQFVKKVENCIHRIFKVLRALLLPPYDEPSCRLQIYNLLKHLALNKKMSWGTVSFAITVFENGKLDHDLEVSSLCMESSKLCELFLSGSKAIRVPISEPNETVSAVDQAVRQNLTDIQFSLFRSKIIISKCGDESNSVLGFENDKAIFNGSGIRGPLHQNMDRGQHGASQDEELDYGYDDEDGFENAEDEEEEECETTYNNYHHRDSRRRKRSHQYEEEEEEEDDDDEEEEEEEDEEEEAEDDEEGEGEDDDEDENYDDGENGEDERHNSSLPVSNDSHNLSRHVEIAVKTLNHSDRPVDREEDDDDEGEQFVNSTHSESPEDRDPRSLVINENGLNSCSSEERDDKEFDVPAPKRLKRFHDVPCSAENNEGSIAEVKEEIVSMEEMNATEMLADFVDCSPDASQQTNPPAE